VLAPQDFVLAGIIGLPARNGVDQQLRVNHLGPFLLTRLLLPSLAAHARVVNVASRSHNQGSLRIRDGKIVGVPGHW
jgi:NAD(P)-dependent dehydrogenase (short-subunit alcohol dehydrogenase family)